MKLAMPLTIEGPGFCLEVNEAEFEVSDDAPAEFLGFEIEGLKFTRDMLVQLLSEAQMKAIEESADEYALLNASSYSHDAQRAEYMGAA